MTAIAGLSPTVKSFFLAPERPFAFRAGQHVEVRLTAADGYRAERSYSIASAPGGPLELAIERLDDGEVSPFFHEVVAVGDTIEIRGPIGGHFVWSPADGGPVLLVGGGSGIAPLVAMLRHRAATGEATPFALVYSARREDDILFRDDLYGPAGTADGAAVFVTLTRAPTPLAGARLGRIDRPLVEDALAALGEAPKTAYVCGSTAFVEATSLLLIEAGVPFAAIRTERYGGAPLGRAARPDAVPEA